MRCESALLRALHGVCVCGRWQTANSEMLRIKEEAIKEFMKMAGSGGTKKAAESEFTAAMDLLALQQKCETTTRSSASRAARALRAWACSHVYVHVHVHAAGTRRRSSESRASRASSAA